MIELAPIVFTPYLKKVIWGGNRICTYKDIAGPAAGIGESWEISAVPGHESVVSQGAYKGMSITGLIDRFGSELLGSKVIGKYGRKFPLLVKIIDAADNLSIQVHPDDRLAAQRHGCLGKTEMWYIIDSGKDAKIFAGLNTAMTPDDYVAHVTDGTFAETLAVHHSSPGDVFFLPAGRVHAIGAGNLLAEIQESSDITYRIFDYDRRDADGRPRELHTALAKDAIDFTVHSDYKTPRPSDDDTDCELVRCSHFTTRRIIVDGDTGLVLAPGSFSVIMCIDGNVALSYSDRTTTLSKGTTALIPAAMTSLKIIGKSTILLINS